MKKFAIVAAAALTAATFGMAAIAQDTTAGDFDKVDANKDSMVSWDEALGAYPTLTQAVFDQADENKDGSLDDSEFISLLGLTAGLGDSGTTSEMSSSAM